MKQILSLIFSIDKDDIVIDYNQMHNKPNDSYNLLLIRVFNNLLNEMIEENSI